MAWRFFCSMWHQLRTLGGIQLAGRLLWRFLTTSSHVWSLSKHDWQTGLCWDCQTKPLHQDFQHGGRKMIKLLIWLQWAERKLHNFLRPNFSLWSVGSNTHNSTQIQERERENINESLDLREKSDCYYLFIQLHKLLLSSVIMKLDMLNISKNISYESTTPSLGGKNIKEFAALL